MTDFDFIFIKTFNRENAVVIFLGKLLTKIIKQVVHAIDRVAIPLKAVITNTMETTIQLLTILQLKNRDDAGWT